MVSRLSIRSKISEILRECTLEAIRSQGPGGQNVNKTSSAIRIRWSLKNSYVLNDEEKNFLRGKLSSELTLSEEIIFRSEAERDQLTNRKACFEKMEALLVRSLFVPKKRLATKPTRSSQRKRLEGKKINSEKKVMRGRVK